MDYEYDCFISYTHADERKNHYAQQLTDWLQRAKLKVWRDSAGIHGGRPINETIYKGLVSSRCLICLVTEEWYKSDFVNWEVMTFSESSPEKRQVIPMLMTVRDVGKMGPYLARAKDILGFDDPARKHAAFWQLYCAVTGADLGPEADWESFGKGIANGLAPGRGGLRIIGLPDGTESSAVRLYTSRRGESGDGEAWDGHLVQRKPGFVRVVLSTPNLYDEQEANVEEGMIVDVRLDPKGVIWPSDRPLRHPGFGPAGDILVYVVYERTTQEVLAARIAHIANRIVGHKVLLEQWVYYKEKGDGALEDFISTNSLLYHEDDSKEAETLYRQLRHAHPPIRLTKHKGGKESRAHFFGVKPFPDGFTPRRMIILLVEAPGGNAG